MLDDGFKKAFEAFMGNEEEVKDAIDMATRQSYGGDHTVVVELFPEGGYRVLPCVGNLYSSRGTLVSIPSLGGTDDDVTDRYYRGGGRDRR